jgi:D-lactate dehydrogenase (cytochrome)
MRIAHNKKAYPHIRKISTDAAVPESSFQKSFHTFTELISKNRLEAVIFGHLGDFHLHFNILPHTQAELEKGIRLYNELMEEVISNGGTVSAEHGIGKIKVDYLVKMVTPDAVREMKKIKQILDPGGILSPGNLFQVE